MHTFLKRKQTLRFSIAGKNAPFGETDNPVTLSTLKLLKEGFFFNSFMVVIYLVKIFLILQEVQFHYGC